MNAILRWPRLCIEEAVLLDNSKEIHLNIRANAGEKVHSLRIAVTYKLRILIKLLGSDYKVNIHFIYENMYKSQINSTEAICPKYTKKRTAGWVVLIGDIETKQIWGCERVQFGEEPKKYIRVHFCTPQEP